MNRTDPATPTPRDSSPHNAEHNAEDVFDVPVAVWEALCEDAFVRRELLWLEAFFARRNEGDLRKRQVEVETLERSEPGLGEHMQRLVADFARRDPSAAPLGPEDYTRLYDERLAHHIRRLARAVVG